MKRFYIVFLLLINQVVFSQNEPLFTQFWNNYSLINPASTALKTKHYANVQLRKSFSEYGYNPNTISLQYEKSLPYYNSGIGGGYVFDARAQGSSNKLYLNLAYHIPLQNENTINCGVSIDYQYKTLNYIKPAAPPLISPLPKPSAISQGKFNVNFGIIYKTKKLQLGISLTQINQPDFDKLLLKNKRYFFASASYEFGKGNNISYIPTLFYRSDFVLKAIELNNLVKIKNIILLGFTIRPRDTYGFMLGVDFNEKFKLLYSYDLIAPAAFYDNKFHEVSMSFRINK